MRKSAPRLSPGRRGSTRPARGKCNLRHVSSTRTRHPVSTAPPQPAPPAPAAGPVRAAEPAPGRGDCGPESDLVLARRLLAAESAAVAGLADRLGPEFHAAIDLLVACVGRHGTVLVTGLGKSGLVGAKLAATLTSLGVPAHFIHPAEAAHGDLGNFRPQDVCVALSYSGETDEVVALASLLRQDGIPVISITAGAAPGASPSRGLPSLDRLAAVRLSIGRVEEDAALSPAPMVSTTAMIALGDALALCASARLAFTHDDFARRHPGGALGELLRPIVEALRFTVGKNLFPAPDDVSVAEALRTGEQAARRPGALLLVDRATGVLTGLFTDADLRRLVLKDPAALAQPVSDHMTRRPGTLAHTARVRDAVRMVHEFRRDEIPVVDDAGRPIGLLDVQDLVALRLVRE